MTTCTALALTHHTRQDHEPTGVRRIPAGFNSSGLFYYQTPYATKAEYRKGLPRLIEDFEALGGEITVVPRGKSGIPLNRSAYDIQVSEFKARVRRKRAWGRMMGDFRTVEAILRHQGYRPGTEGDYMRLRTRIIRKLF